MPKGKTGLVLEVDVEHIASKLLTSILPVALAELAELEDSTHSVASDLAIAAYCGEWVTIAKTGFDPSLELSAEQAQVAFAATELCRKAEFLPGTSDEAREAHAKGAFLDAEARCAKTNLFLRSCFFNSASLTTDQLETLAILGIAQRKIARVLGGQPVDVDDLIASSRWSKGANCSVKSSAATPYHKWSAKWTSTRRAQKYLHLLMDRYPAMCRFSAQREDAGVHSPLSEVVAGGGFTTVPKDAFRFRGIVPQPSLNIHLQLGVGKLWRPLLKRFCGIDLSSQDKNRRLALEGSMTGNIATIDLTSASDLNSSFLVQVLLDPFYHSDVDEGTAAALRSWFRVLSDLRCESVELDGRWLNLSQWSSMGNGYTFELESLIFWALASASCERHGGQLHAVYGDDILVSSDAYDHVIRTLALFGHQPNKKKSFATGPFRESCGMNAYQGVSLESFRFGTLENLSDVYSAINGLRRIGCKRAANALQRLLKAEQITFGPAHLNDHGDPLLGDIVIANPDFTSWTARPHGREQGWFFWGHAVRVLKFEGRRVKPVFYEPALMHVWGALEGLPGIELPAVLRRLSFRSSGEMRDDFVQLKEGKWTFGESLVLHDHYAERLSTAPDLLMEAVRSPEPA